ncbi:MAG: hypothetical protein IT410_01930 [Candidatus Doudnabacteria bacterium]|nr:hypothetical protein [Candidatus Doudnabacteria bacterium]
MKKLTLLLLSITLISGSCTKPKPVEDNNLLRSPQETAKTMTDLDSSLPPEQSPLIEDDSDLKNAEKHLVWFFDFIADHNYNQGLSLYGGGYANLYDWNPDVDPFDKPLLFSRGCEQNGWRCLKIKSVTSKERIGPGKYSFKVQFLNPDGTLFVKHALEGQEDQTDQTEFTYEVVKLNGKFYVITEPQYVS